MSNYFTCYYYDEEHNRCRCYVNKNLDELLVENANLRQENQSIGIAAYEIGGVIV